MTPEGNALEPLQDRILRWCKGAVPRRSNTSFELHADIEGERVCVSIGPAKEAVTTGWGCVQDVLLSALTVELALSGKVDLGAPIGSYLPELNEGTAPGFSVRLGDLLCHASGLNAPASEPEVAAFDSWSSFCSFHTSKQMRFPPGRVAEYELNERILLVEILSRILGRSPYAAIVEMLPSDIAIRFAEPRRNAQLELKQLIGAASDILALVRHLTQQQSSWLTYAVTKPHPGSVSFFESGKVDKDFVPLHVSCGALGYNNRLWGQAGTSDDYHTGVRFDEEGRLSLVGVFANKLDRDLVLNEVCGRLGFARAESSQTKRVGYLNGFNADELTGDYDFGSRGTIKLSTDRGRLLISTPRGGTLPCHIEDDGGLTSPAPWPSVWIEPFLHPTSGTPCITIGQAVCIRV